MHLIRTRRERKKNVYTDHDDDFNDVQGRKKNIQMRNVCFFLLDMYVYVVDYCDEEGNKMVRRDRSMNRSKK